MQKLPLCSSSSPFPITLRSRILSQFKIKSWSWSCIIPALHSLCIGVMATQDARQWWIRTINFVESWVGSPFSVRIKQKVYRTVNGWRDVAVGEIWYRGESVRLQLPLCKPCCSLCPSLWPLTIFDSWDSILNCAEGRSGSKTIFWFLDPGLAENQVVCPTHNTPYLCPWNGQDIPAVCYPTRKMFALLGLIFSSKQPGLSINSTGPEIAIVLNSV